MATDTREIVALLADHGDVEKLPLVLAAIEAHWGDVHEYLRVGYAAGLDCGGLWQCEHCGDPVEDPAHPCCNVGCHMLDDGSGVGDAILCEVCYEAALDARRKIVVEDVTDDDGEVVSTHEDDSALTDGEQTLAGYLNRDDDGRSRRDRSHIASYPRDERGQLHRYQEQIDASRARRGKTVR